MRQYKIHPIWTLLLLLFAVGCEKDTETVSLLAQLEQIEADADAKSYLEDESWIYWDTDDKFSVSTDLMGSDFTNSVFEMRDGSYFNAVFNIEAPEGSQKFIALFPQNDNHTVSWQGGELSSLQLNIPATQAFRTDDKGDYTFGKEAMPMVAYEPYAEVLHFHSLGGIVRIQLYATGNTTNTKTVTGIEFKELNGKQISGLFNVRDWDQFEPYLESTSTAEADKQISLSCSRAIASGTDGFLTFYLVLPAYQPQSMSDNTTGTPYKLQMTVKASDGTQCVKNFSVMVRRNGLSMLRALEIDEWVSTGNGNANVQLVGNGTQDRPFKIYTVDDLIKVRDAFNADANQGTINGMLPTENTFFELMRNDIELTPQTWTEGIRNFKGHFVFKANTSSSMGHGITNTSGVPIFESIAPSGVVEGLVVKGNASFNYQSFNGNFYFSPICYTNDGTIKDCIINSGSQISAAVLSSTSVEQVGVTGFAVTNNGRIIGCSNQGSLSAPNRIVAGICLFNGTHGKIISCNILSPSGIQAARIGGICYRNEGAVRDCYTAFNTAASQNATNADWGGIVFENMAVVTKCVLMPSGVINTTKSMGGIANININSGIIDTCRNNASTAFAQGVMGGIVAYNSGTIRNSCCDIPNSVFWFESTASANAVGGLVGMMTAGTLENSYCRVQIFANTGAVKGSVVGNVSAGTFNYCYGWNNVSSATPFYGAKSGSPVFTNAYNYNVASDGVTLFTCDGSKCYVGTTELSDLLNSSNTTGYMAWGSGNPHPVFKK